ncbi:U6 small nuclear RNA (adenine-(43)-N(6))-methyltransferase [Aphelenchoides besseyi]|nr:U6 small nuclear RNA (adenine-(43)-N(6))-methyltransferase [Aphelenchoides besseyi]KAI6211295.1 U6 small nuclear RNA (adenine-(43)-N(6))-methyltransferase [Aphelenchoides besseyi]
MRDLYSSKPVDFKLLARKYADFRRHCSLTTSGKIFANFKSDKFVRELAIALLRENFDLDVRLPLGTLAPRIPQRYNYIRLIDQLVESNNLNRTNVVGLDIGTGASCIYPLLGARECGWQFYATELNSVSAEQAKENVERNSLVDRVSVLKVDGIHFFKDVFDCIQELTFCVCNPPFYHDNELEQKFRQSSSGECQNLCDNEATNSPHSQTFAKDHELAIEGGEVQFVRKIIDESCEYGNRIRFCSSMLGKKSSIRPLKSHLLASGITNCAVHILAQGRTHRWVLVWSFDNELQLNIMAIRMETDEPHPPINVDISPIYRASFEFKRFIPVTKHWDISLKFLDRSNDSILATKPITWPFTEPPNTIRYDADRSVLFWENGETNACIPLQIPTYRCLNRLTDSAQPAGPKANPALVVRPGFSGSSKSQSSKKSTTKETPWKDAIIKIIAKNGKLSPKKSKATTNGKAMVTNGVKNGRNRRESTTSMKSLQNGHTTNGGSGDASMNGTLKELRHSFTDIDEESADDAKELNTVDEMAWQMLIETLKSAPDFNPLIEERLPVDDQCSALQLMSVNYHLTGMCVLLTRMIEMRFFELVAINKFITKTCKNTGVKLPPSTSKLTAIGTNTMVVDLVNNPSVVLFAPAYAALLQQSTEENARDLRFLLLQKNFPAVDLTAILISDFDLTTSIRLIELFYEDFVVFGADSKFIEKACDLLTLITDSLTEKIAWNTDGIHVTRLKACQKSLFYLTNLSKTTQKLLTLNQLNSKYPDSCLPQVDYRVYYRKLYRRL